MSQYLLTITFNWSYTSNELIKLLTWTAQNKFKPLRPYKKGSSKELRHDILSRFLRHAQ